MSFGVLATFREFLRKTFGPGTAFPPTMMRALLRTHRTQVWFQGEYGRAMAGCFCQTCGIEQPHTIWPDGNYYCLICLFRQASREMLEPIPIDPSDRAMREFLETWPAYRRHFMADVIIPIRPPARSPDSLQPAPEPICDIADCEVCGTRRPHVAAPDGGMRCFHCLTAEGLQQARIAQPKRATRELREDAARAVAESLRVAR